MSRKFVEDKVYLKGPDGRIWEYESMLASLEGYNEVVPNPSKKTLTAEDAKKAEEAAGANGTPSK